MKPRTLIQKIVPFAITVLVLILVFIKVPLGRFVETLSDISVMWLIIGLGFYVLNTALRAFRFQMLLQSDRLPFHQLFKISCFHAFFNYLLPARSGELSFIYCRRIDGLACPGYASHLCFDSGCSLGSV